MKFLWCWMVKKGCNHPKLQFCMEMSSRIIRCWHFSICRGKSKLALECGDIALVFWYLCELGVQVTAKMGEETLDALCRQNLNEIWVHSVLPTWKVFNDFDSQATAGHSFEFLVDFGIAPCRIESHTVTSSYVAIVRCLFGSLGRSLSRPTSDRRKPSEGRAGGLKLFFVLLS